MLKVVRIVSTEPGRIKQKKDIVNFFNPPVSTPLPALACPLLCVYPGLSLSHTILH